MGEVAARLDLGDAYVIFGHTHRAGPFPGDDQAEWRGRGGARLVNCGSWTYAAIFMDHTGSQNPYWPGVCVIVGPSGPPRARPAARGRGDSRQMSSAGFSVRDPRRPTGLSWSEHPRREAGRQAAEPSSGFELENAAGVSRGARSAGGRPAAGISTSSAVDHHPARAVEDTPDARRPHRVRCRRPPGRPSAVRGSPRAHPPAGAPRAARAGAPAAPGSPARFPGRRPRRSGSRTAGPGRRRGSEPASPGSRTPARAQLGVDQHRVLDSQASDGIPDGLLLAGGVEARAVDPDHSQARLAVALVPCLQVGQGPDRVGSAEVPELDQRGAPLLDRRNRPGRIDPGQLRGKQRRSDVVVGNPQDSGRLWNRRLQGDAVRGGSGKQGKDAGRVACFAPERPRTPPGAAHRGPSRWSRPSPAGSAG